MMSKVRYHPLFECDVREATGWYQQRSSVVADTFVEAVETRVREVIKSPQQFGRAFDDVRFARVPRFPYIILFESGAAELRIYGVLHSASDPAKWRDRLGKTGN